MHKTSGHMMHKLTICTNNIVWVPCFYFSSRLYPGQPSYHNNLGTVLSDATEAEACYRETLRLHPTHRGALVNLGNLLLCVMLVIKRTRDIKVTEKLL